MDTLARTSTGAQPSSATAGSNWLLLLPLLATIALFLPGNPNFGFDAPGWLDPFVYVGYFWHYPEHLSLFDTYYKISRLPWILPGFAIHRLFGEIAASYVLHGITLSGGGVALYLLVRDAFHNRYVAAITSVMWVCSTAAHGVGGWNYHMLAAADYYLLTSWLMLTAGRAASSGWRSVAAGAAAAATVHTHLFFVVFLPLLAAFYLVVVWQTRTVPWRRLLTDSIRMASGGLALTAALMVVNRATGGAWLFFMPQIEYTRWLSTQVNGMWLPASKWLPGALYLALPIMAIVASTIVLRGLKGERFRLAAVFAAQGWATLLLYAFYQFTRRTTVLQPEYMAFGVYTSGLTAVAVVLLGRGQQRWPRPSVQTGLACAAIVAILVAGGTMAMQLKLQHLVAAVGMPPLATIVIAGLTTLLAATLLPASVRALAIAIWFAAFNSGLAGSALPYGTGSPGIHRSMLKLFRQTDRFTARLDPSLLGIKYWFPSRIVQTSEGPVDMAAIFNSFVATRGWAGNLLNQGGPAVPLEELGRDRLEMATCVGLLSPIEDQEATRSQFLAAAAEAEIPTREVARQRFSDSTLSYELSVYRVAEAPAQSGKPPCLGP